MNSTDGSSKNNALECASTSDPDKRFFASHPHWKDELVLSSDGTFLRAKTRCSGSWVDLSDGIIGLRWDKWTHEMLVPDLVSGAESYRVHPWHSVSNNQNGENRFAFAILNHAEPNRLLRLVHSLNKLFGCPPICCHHDFGQQALDPKLFPSNVEFVRPSLGTNWGGFSLVEATILTLRKCAAYAPKWTYLLSGADYPVVTSDRMVLDLDAEIYSAYLDFERIDPLNIERSWHNNCVNRYLSKPGWHHGYVCYAGSQWMTLGLRAIYYLSDCFSQRHPLVDYYRKCFIADESLIHTLLVNSNLMRLKNTNWRYVDWIRGYPKTITTDDLERIADSGAHFARKFQGESANSVLDEIDRRLGIE
jgi:hypothetical protein